MYYRNFKNIPEKVSLLGFGCMRLPVVNKETEEIDESLAMDLIDYSIQNGVTYFDTAYPYHKGNSEIFIGKALKRFSRDKFYLASKMPMWSMTSKEMAEEVFFEQLKKCQVEYFDFYLVHNMNKDNYEKAIKYDIIALLQEYKKQGLIRRLGFSFHDKASLLASHLDNHPWDFVQIQLNYLDWDLQNAKKQYELITNKNIPVIVMEPVRGGALAKLSDLASMKLKEYNPESSIASWAIRYAASKTNVLTVLSGMSDFSQVKDNVETISNFKPLDKKEHELLNEALTIYLSSGTIPCTGCRYCMDCPEGVDIPKVFAIYNQYMISHNKWSFINSYFRALEESKQAEHCIACQKCVNKCPQAIDIPKWMDAIRELAGTFKE